MLSIGYKSIESNVRIDSRRSVGIFLMNAIEPPLGTERLLSVRLVTPKRRQRRSIRLLHRSPPRFSDIWPSAH
jgi:hypothetical protein